MKKSKKSLVDRRKFLKGAAVGGVATLGRKHRSGGCGAAIFGGSARDGAANSAEGGGSYS